MHSKKAALLCLLGMTAAAMTACQSSPTTTEDTTSSEVVSSDAAVPDNEITTASEDSAITSDPDDNLAESEVWFEEEWIDEDFGDSLVSVEPSDIIGSWNSEYVSSEGEDGYSCAMDITEDGTVYLAFGHSTNYTGQYLGTWKPASEAENSEEYPEDAILVDLTAMDINELDIEEIHTVLVFYDAGAPNFFVERVSGDSLIPNEDFDYMYFSEAFG